MITSRSRRDGPRLATLQARASDKPQDDDPSLRRADRHLAFAFSPGSKLRRRDIERRHLSANSVQGRYENSFAAILVVSDGLDVITDPRELPSVFQSRFSRLVGTRVPEKIWMQQGASGWLLFTV